MGRFYQLDYLRGIAAICVVLFHFTYGYDNGLKILSPYKFYFSYGNLGVYLFFLVSGYVIFMTLERVKKPFDFVVSRFSRLYPAYWSAILISLFFVTILPTPFNYSSISFKDLLVNLTMFQHWFRVKNFDGAFWTLAIELSFYFIMFIVYLFGALRYIQKISFFWLAVSLFVYYVNFTFKNVINFVLLLDFAPLFIAGIMFYKIKSNENTVKNNLIILVAFLLQSYYSYELYEDIYVIFILSSFFLVFYYISLSKVKIVKPNKILNFLGTISYSLYLIHENFGYSMIFYLKQILDKQIFYIPISIIVVILFAWLITKYIERPMMTIIKNKYAKYSS